MAITESKLNEMIYTQIKKYFENEGIFLFKSMLQEMSNDIVMYEQINKPTSIRESKNLYQNQYQNQQYSSNYFFI